MFAGLKSMGLRGIDGFIVEVEADLSQGLPGFDVVGLPDTAVRESRDRVRSAMKNAGFTYPVSRITVNLAPADVKKEGSVYDLPLLLALLCGGALGIERQRKNVLLSANFLCRDPCVLCVAYYLWSSPPATRV